MAKILVIRFDALGDVAMTIPVIHSFAAQYPEHEIVFLSRELTSPLFTNMPQNVRFHGVDLKAYPGLKGLNRLYGELKTEKFDYIADLNAVFRSLYITLRFGLAGKSCSIIRKGKSALKVQTRKSNKDLTPVKTTFERYRDVFTRLGFSFEFNFTSIFSDPQKALLQIEAVTGQKNNNKWIGIAPFAKHRGKIYPIELQEKVVAYFSAKPGVQVFLFGGGPQEKEIFKQWKEKYPSVFFESGKLKIYEELILMSNLDVMVSMDSANMHLASLSGTPVISIWGATHPASGFLGWKQDQQNIIQLPMACRPCSSHGTKPCLYGTWECMSAIAPQTIIDKIESVLAQFR